MYADPSLIRDHVVKLYLNDNEAGLVDALVNFTGQQKGPFLRELLLEQARLVLSGDADFRPTGTEGQGLAPALASHS